MKRFGRRLLARNHKESSFTRREFFHSCATGTGVLLLCDPSAAAEFGTELPTHRFRVRRDVDLLDLTLSFVNFREQNGFLEAIGRGQSKVVVGFPPQNIGEASF